MVINKLIIIEKESGVVRRFISLLIIVFLGYVSKPLWEEPVKQFDNSSIWDSIRSKIDLVIENEDIDLTVVDLQEKINSFLTPPEDSHLEINDENKGNSPLPLAVPEEQFFSIHNIELGFSRAEVEEETGGSAQRTSKNEYDVNWEAYHVSYQNFILVAYDDEDIVRGLYTNQDLIASKTEIKLGSPMQLVHDHLGTPESFIKKGVTNYQIKSNGEYDEFYLENSYVTVFYDQHENNTVTAIKVIDEELEQDRDFYYSQPSQELKEGFEYQLFDLTNSTRVNHHLPILTWDEQVRETSRRHSLDMAENQYFGHTNLEGQSPFERMEEDNIQFKTAGENLAFGQISSIFAHEGLMNSLGHRENTLQEHYRYLGVGVAFNSELQPYFTKKYYSNSWTLLN